MLDFIKKQWIAFYASIVAVILAIVAVIIYGINATDAYFVDQGSGNIDPAVIVFTIFAIVIIIGRVVAAELVSDNKIVKIVLDIAAIVACVFLAAAFMCFVGQRVYDFAIVLASDLQAGNDAAYAAVNQSIGGLVVYGISLVISIALSFFTITRNTDSADADRDITA